MMRIGMGYDIHRLVLDRQLVLGGVSIPFTHGLLGHSDADVVLHAIGDALLGAAGLGDLGQHFPDTDPQFKGASSAALLNNIMTLLRKEKWTLGNVDVTLIAEAPKLAPYREALRESIAQILSVAPKQVSIKFTTHEGLGEIGRVEAMAAHVVVLICGQ